MSAQLRTVIFVDGQNFHKNIGEFKIPTISDCDPFYLQEEHFNWNKFFYDVCKRFDIRNNDMEHQIFRTYWYNADSITPLEIWDSTLDKSTRECKKSCPEITSDQVKSLIINWYESEKKRFDATRNKLEQIQRKTDYIEFKFIGQYKVSPHKVYDIKPQEDTYIYKGTREGEKGVDIGMAVDMIAKMPYYDAAIIVSGDADFIPVVRYIKDHMKLVYQFSVAKGVPPRIKHLSPWLKGIVDAYEVFNEKEFLDDYIDREMMSSTIQGYLDKYICSL